MLVQGSTKYVR